MNLSRGGPYWIDAHDRSAQFPDVELALCDPDGLLAVGGDLSTKRLITAYRKGIFPWYNQDQPILWWSPNPRTVLFPERLHVSRSLQKVLAKNTYTVTLDTAFTRVIKACAGPRRGEPNGTWITAAMIAAYSKLHRMGLAHSVEAWHQGELVGGIYGVAVGRVFFGESMFSHRANASKVAFVHLAQWLRDWGYVLLDCQTHSGHLAHFGAQQIPRVEFTRLLTKWCDDSWSSGLERGDQILVPS